MYVNPPPKKQREPARPAEPAQEEAPTVAPVSIEPLEGVAPLAEPAPPDLTRWMALAGAGAFVILFIVAASVYVMGQFRDMPAIPTSVITDPTALAQTAEAQPSATAQPSPTQGAATPTIVAATPEPEPYIVQSGDTLLTIAQNHGLSLDDLLAANPTIADPNQVAVGQQILLPLLPTPDIGAIAPTGGFEGFGTAGPTQAATSTPEGAVFEGDLAGNYPQTLSGARLTLHYQLEALPSQPEAEALLRTAETILAGIERTLDVEYEGLLDVYVAGKLFVPPNEALRGRAFPTQRRVFVLFDGTGNEAERQYMLAHEITHVVAWHTYGIPSTVLLSEGLAAYAGQDYLAEGGFISYADLCRALAAVNRLPTIPSIQNNIAGFAGHIRTMYNYSTAACFVDYLFEAAGAEAFAELYPTSNYSANYNAGLGQLEADFRARLAQGGTPGFDAQAQTLVSDYDEVQADYDRLFIRDAPDLETYRVLDKARVAVLTGDFGSARTLLDQVKTTLP